MTSGWWDDGKVAAAIDTPGPMPHAGGDIVRWAGGRRALTEQLSGMSGPPQKGDYPDEGSYKAASTRWRSASRRAQRLDDEGKAGKQRRGVSKGPRFTPDERGRIDEAARDRKLARLMRDGAQARIRVRVRINTPDPQKGGDTREREIPSGGPGIPISREEVNEVLRLLESRDPSDAELALVDYVTTEYFGEAGGLDVDVEEVLSVKVWPDGDREPA